MTKVAHDTMTEVEENAYEISERIRSFAESAAVFSCDNPRLIELYDGRWVGVYEGEVKAVADSFDELTRTIVEHGFPLEETIIRHISREQKTMIL